MHTKTMLSIKSASHHLMLAMEILGAIPEGEYRQLVRLAQKETKAIENIKFSCGLGNPFMTIFRVREWLEQIAS